MEKAEAFYTILYNETYLNILIDYWIQVTSYKFTSIQDFLKFWFDAWFQHAPLDFALNWCTSLETNEGLICLFDIQHKKPDPNKKTKEEINDFNIKNIKLREIQKTFCVPESLIESTPALLELSRAFAKVLPLFTQNKLPNKKIKSKQTCFYKFRFNSICDVGQIIVKVYRRLRETFYKSRPLNDHALFEELVYNYRKQFVYIDGLFNTNKIV
jgi:hypothetical protein